MQTIPNTNDDFLIVRYDAATPFNMPAASVVSEHEDEATAIKAAKSLAATNGLSAFGVYRKVQTVKFVPSVFEGPK